MVIGKPFEVSKDVYERAKENCKNRADGLYDCQLHEEDGKYICTWMHGSSCD